MSFEKHFSRRDLTKTIIGGSAAAAGLSVTTRGFAQDEATPVGEEAPENGLPPLPEGAVLVAGELWNPRFVALADDGMLYVTEQGLGGDEVIESMPPEAAEADAEAGATPVPQATPEPEGPQATRGFTGQLSMIDPEGARTVLVEGIASYSEGIGAHGIALGAGEIYYAVGGMAVLLGLEPLDGENILFRYVLETGELSEIADLGAYEVENNPDGEDVNPNLYQIDHAPAGNLIVTDAGGNTVFNVDIETGEFELAGVVPNITELTGVEPTEEMGSGQGVPTATILDQTGDAYVALLREAWPDDAPSLLLMADGAFDPIVTEPGLSWTVALAVGPDGNLYASQLFGEFTEQGPGPGSVVRITGDGAVEPVVENVMMPHGMAFDPEGNMYLLINTLMSGPDAPAGQLIRIDGVAPAVG